MNLHQSGALDRAMQMYRDVLVQDPRQADALHLLGAAEWQKGNLEEAERLMRKAIDVWDEDTGYFCDLGGLLLAKGKAGDAAVTYHQALQLDPANRNAREGLVKAFGQLGYDYSKEYRWEEAEKAYQRLLELRPAMPPRSTILARFTSMPVTEPRPMTFIPRQLPRSLIYCSRAITARFAISAQENLNEGWADLTASNKAWLQVIDTRKDLPWLRLPLWDGSNLRGKKIIVWGDQGIGDEILFADMIPDLLAQGAEVTVECTDRLVPIFQRSFPEIITIARAPENLPDTDFDFQIPGIWLGRWLRQSFDSFSSQQGYLKADADKTEKLRRRYEAFGKEKIVGIAWHSTSEGRAVHRRMTLQEMAQYLPCKKDILYVNLQYGDHSDEIEEAKRAFLDFNFYDDKEVDQLRDMDLFAAQIAACDKIVSIGNTTAHLAGALGIAGNVLLPIAGLTWYWFEKKEQSPWYPQLRLLRKATEGDWSAALERIVL